MLMAAQLLKATGYMSVAYFQDEVVSSRAKGNEKVVGGKKHLWKQLCTYSFSVNAPFKYENCYLCLREIVECDMQKITKKA